MKHFLILFSALFLIMLLSQSCEDVIGLDEKVSKKKVDTIDKDTIVNEDTTDTDTVYDSVLEFEPKEIDFEQTPLGDAKSLYFCITNTSDEDFVISSVESDNPAFFVMPEILPAKVPPQGKYCLAVEFYPDEKGDYTGKIIINGNPELFLILKGTCI